MSAEEAEPLNPNPEQDMQSNSPPNTLPQQLYLHGEDDDTAAGDAIDARLATIPKRPNKRDPLFVVIPYSISFLVSFAGFGVGIAGYIITLYGPFDEESRTEHRKVYDEHFILMQSILFFLGFNSFWTIFNLVHAYRGCQENLWLINHVYDFLLWALLIAFPVLNMVEMLFDRGSMCEFKTPDGNPIYEYNEKCEGWKLALLVVEMVSINLGILVAVIHFGLMIGRCCTHSNIKMKIRERIAEEEGYLVELMERRKLLEDEHRLDVERPLPALPVEANQSNENISQPVEDNLIDIAPEAPGRTSKSSEFTPYTSADGSETPEYRTLEITSGAQA